MIRKEMQLDLLTDGFAAIQCRNGHTANDTFALLCRFSGFDPRANSSEVHALRLVVQAVFQVDV
ncbi:hypothetical protein [Fuscovulum blasticum]|uniref:hypothetical protein n=1 Tax=Fuscovulum blasticum TaxID=1075 RepID=UPI000F4DB5D7|nr:hypothetical protein [Fuscovulum blasticum]